MERGRGYSWVRGRAQSARVRDCVRDHVRDHVHVHDRDRHGCVRDHDRDHDRDHVHVRDHVRDRDCVHDYSWGRVHARFGLKFKSVLWVLAGKLPGKTVYPVER